MRLTILSFDGLNLQDTNFNAFWPQDERTVFNLAAVDVQELRIAGTWPKLTGLERRAKKFLVGVECLGTFATQMDTLRARFDTKKGGAKKLLAQDENSKQWYLMCKCADEPRIETSYCEFLLHAPDPTWHSEVEASTLTAVTTSGQTWTVTPAGNDTEIKPRIAFKPVNAMSGGYGFKAYRPITNPIDKAFVDYPYDITDGGLNTATLVSGGKMQADGDDLRVLLAGAETDRWVSGINTATTKVWINVNLAPMVQLALLGSITNVATVTELPWKKTKANKEALKKLPATGTVIRGGEAFTYTAIDIEKYKCMGVTRAAKGTLAVAHADGNLFDWVQKDCWILYGNSAAIAPEIDNTKMPLIDLATSTNTSHVLAAFTSEDGLRTGGFKLKVLKGAHTDTYSGNHGADDQDPATELGMVIRAYQTASGWRGEDGSVEGRYYNPAGITAVFSCTGEKQCTGISWPLAKLRKSVLGKTWVDVWSEAKPTALNTWETWTHNAVSLVTTQYHLQFLLDGVVAAGVAAGVGAEANFEVNDITLTLDSNRVPKVTLGAEQANYHLDGTLTNVTTGKSISFRWTMKLNETLTVDTLNKTIIYQDNTNALAALGEFGRIDWLDLLSGANTISWEQTGTAQLQVDFYYRDGLL